MSAPTRLFVFQLNGQRYALPLSVVERIVRAVEVTALPGAPGVVMGLIDAGGRVLPVLSLRRRLGLPQREVDPADQFLIARSERRALALLIDSAQGVIECDPAAVIDPQRIAPGLEQFRGVVQLADGLVLIHDLDRFLSLDEARALDAAMGQAA